MRTRSSGRTGLAVLVLASALTIVDWVPAPRAEAFPETVSRQVAVDLATMQAPALRAAGGRLVAAEAAVTPAKVVCAPIRFTAVALTWEQATGRSPHAVLETGEGPTSFGPPVELHDAEGPDPGSADAIHARRATDPLWVGSARCVRFRLEIPAGVTLSILRAVFANTSGTAGVPTKWEPAPEAGAAGDGVAAATAPKPFMTGRPAWGANEALRNCGPDYAPALKIAFVHHTATENNYPSTESDDIVRSIYFFHTETRGWCDIAYNFLVDRFGKVFIGRFGGVTLPVIGAAQQGFNTGAVSVAGIGSYGTTAPAAMVGAIQRLLAWRLDVAHLPPKGWVWMISGGGPATKFPEGQGVSLPLISGHRHTGYTSCPGDMLFNQLPGIRQRANDIGLPKMWRPKQSVDTFTPGLESVHYTSSASVSLNWTVTVVSQQTTATMATFKRTGIALDVEWTGMNGLFAVPSGSYNVTITATNAAGATARGASFVVTVA
ncbi:MAG: N-acetylmuramoyl-L-alanine amidase [Actinomycetota bacterium]